MKKNIVKIAFVAVIAVACALNLFNSQKSETLSEVALANVEALAAAVATHTLDCGQAGLKMCEATCERCDVTLKSYGNGGSVKFVCAVQ